MAGTPQTITLSFIAKTQRQADALIAKYGKFFDDVQYRVGKLDHFADARNEVLPKVKTDYWFWCDTDDEVDGLEKLRDLMDYMWERGIDAMYLPYEYAYNDLGEPITIQWRERILRTAHPFKWIGRVHETLISDQGPLLDRTDAILIRHQKDEAGMERSAKRNHALLKRAWKEDEDPRTAHYLALSYFNLKQFDKAVGMFYKHIETSGWDEERYRSWFYICQAYLYLKQPELALQAAANGVLELPHRPELYVALAESYMDLDRYKDVLEALTMAGSKGAPTATLSPIDPTYYGYRAEMLAALAYLYLGRPREAYAQLKTVLKHSPNFQTALELLPVFEGAYFDTEAIDKIKWLVSFLKETPNAKPLKILEALPQSLLSDPRLNLVRSTLIKPKTWPTKSLVFLCGQTPEVWGPEYLGEKGIGGSEEAVIYLSRELVKLGWQVTVYNEREEAYEDRVELEMEYDPEIRAYEFPHAHVTYLPLTTFNPQDEFDVFVAWRQPQLLSQVPIKARLRCVDLHDTPLGHQELKEKMIEGTDLYFFKSQFQRQMAPQVPDEKCVIAPNGIVPSQFDHKVKRHPLRVVYGSSYDRGLECLLDLWPQIKAQVPKAELHIYYGWNTFDGMHKKNPQQMKWKLQMIRKMYDVGAIDHGRVSHEDLTKAYLEAGVWAYPTEFPEIDCITATKAQAAGLTPITSGYAALQTSVYDQEPDLGETIYSDESAQERFVLRVVTALKYPETEPVRQLRAKSALRRAWSDIAEQWTEALDGQEK